MATRIGGWRGVIGRGVMAIAMVAVLAGVVEWLGVSRVSAAAFGPGDQARVIDGRLNLRVAAGLSAGIVTVLDDGTLLDVIAGPKAASGMDWYKVETEDETVGWVSGTFLAAPGTGPSFAVRDTVRVIGGRLNFRSEPGLGSEVIMVLEDGTAGAVSDGPVVAGGYVWYEIFNFGIGRGWVAGQYLVADNGISMCDGGGECPSPFEPGDTVRVVTEKLNLRAAPGTGSPVITVLLNGETGEYTGGYEATSEMSWIEITGPYGTGWVARQFVAFE